MDYRHAGSAGKLGMLFKTDAYQNVDDREIAFPITYQGCSRQGRNILVAGQPRMLLAPFRAYDDEDEEQAAPVAHEWRTWLGQEWVVVTLPPAMDGWSKPVLDPTFQVQPDAAAGYDVNMKLANPTLNYGGDVTMGCGNTNKEWNFLIKFDLSSIPDNAIISSTTLRMWAWKQEGSTATSYARTVKRDWVENQATWNVYSTGNSWAAGGCEGSADRGSIVATIPHVSTGWYDVSFTPTSKSELDPWGYGWIFNCPSGSYDRLQFRPSDYWNYNSSIVPKLTIVYSLPVAAAVGPALHRRMRH
jgi:hypothetical protein